MFKSLCFKMNISDKLVFIVVIFGGFFCSLYKHSFLIQCSDCLSIKWDFKLKTRWVMLSLDLVSWLKTEHGWIKILKKCKISSQLLTEALYLRVNPLSLSVAHIFYRLNHWWRHTATFSCLSFCVRPLQAGCPQNNTEPTTRWRQQTAQWEVWTDISADDEASTGES